MLAAFAYSSATLVALLSQSLAYGGAMRFPTGLPTASGSMLAAMPARTPVLETDDAIVLVLGAPGGSARPGYLDGVTRLEKLIFLLERETPIREWMTDKADFRSYRFGPFSSL